MRSRDIGALLLIASSGASALQVGYAAPAHTQPRTAPVTMMGRKFENNKLKMAKTALAYAKKASYIGKKVVVAVKAGGDDPSINRQLAAVMSEGEHIHELAAAPSFCLRTATFA